MASSLRIYVNGVLKEEAAGSHTVWQSGSGEGTMPLVYTSLPLTAVTVGDADVGNTVITVNSTGSDSRNAMIRIVALMVKR